MHEKQRKRNYRKQVMFQSILDGIILGFLALEPKKKEEKDARQKKGMQFVDSGMTKTDKDR